MALGPSVARQHLVRLLLCALGAAAGGAAAELALERLPRAAAGRVLLQSDSSPPMPAPAGPAIQAQGWLVNSGGLCLDAVGQYQFAASNACGVSAMQLWQLRADGSVYNGYTGMCLDNYWGNPSNGNQLDTYPCNQQPSQNWTLPATWPGAIVSGDVGWDYFEQQYYYCVDDGGSGNGHALATIYSCDPTNTNQQWTFRPLTLVGSFDPAGGAAPDPATTPPTSTCMQACAAVFGGQPGMYVGSTNNATVTRSCNTVDFGGLPGVNSDSYSACSAYSGPGCTSAYVADGPAGAALNFCFAAPAAPPPPSLGVPLVVSSLPPLHSWSLHGSGNWSDGGSSPLEMQLFGGVTAQPGTGLVFPGAAGAYACMPALTLGGTDLTFAVWVRFDVLANWARVFDLGVGSASAPCTGMDSANYFIIASEGGSPNSLWAAESQYGTYQPATADNVWAVGVWTHVVVSLPLSLAAAVIYKGGQAVGSTFQPNNLFASPTVFNSAFLGKSQYYGDPFLQGAIAEFQIYTTLLSASLVATLAAGNTAPPLPPNPPPSPPPPPPPALAVALVQAGQPALHSWALAGSPAAWIDGGTSPLPAQLLSGAAAVGGTGLFFPGAAGNAACMPGLVLGGTDLTFSVWASFSAAPLPGGLPRILDLGLGSADGGCSGSDTNNWFIIASVPSYSDGATDGLVAMSFGGMEDDVGLPGAWTPLQWAHVAVTVPRDSVAGNVHPKCSSSHGFCVGIELHGSQAEVYCYGSANSCLWGFSDCSSDADCSKYSASSTLK